MVLGSTAAVNADDLWRGYGRQRVLRGVSLTLPPGRCLAILGPNGSGKSTLLRVLAALLHPARGQVRVCGQDPFADLRARHHAASSSRVEIPCPMSIVQMREGQNSPVREPRLKRQCSGSRTPTVTMRVGCVPAPRCLPHFHSPPFFVVESLSSSQAR